jgi:VanZ family protein
MSSAESPQWILRDWLPVIAWSSLIFMLSTSAFSAEHTSRIIDPILRLLVPGITSASVDVGHMMVRKCAHFTIYCILFWTLVRGPMNQRPYMALLLCVLYAMLDEGHQMLVPGRSASLFDVALDSTGALFSRYLSAAITELV